MKVKESQSAGGVVLNANSQILIVDQGTSWSLPKGHIDKGETKIEAARREIYEESGVSQLELVKELGIYQRYRIADDGKGENKSRLKTIYMFLFRTNQKMLKPFDKDTAGAVWLDKEEAINRLTHPKDKEFLLKVINDL